MSAISRTAGQDENIVRWTVAPLQLAFDMKKRVFLQHLSNAVRTLGMVREAGLEPARPYWTLEPESSESANSTTRANKGPGAENF